MFFPLDKQAKLFKGSIKKTSAGFTLLEMLVAVFIFTIVVTISAGAIVSITGVNRRAQALKTVVNNVNLAIDSISRDIRVGQSYNEDVSGPGLSCANPCDTLKLTISRGGVGENTIFGLDTVGHHITRQRGGASSQNLTGDNISIDMLKFYVLSGPRVLITVSGHAIRDAVGQQNNFTIQTTVAHRNTH